MSDPTDENDELLTAYRLAFGSPAGIAVLADLAPFCRASETCVIPGDRDRTFVLEGRREVFLRIERFAKLSKDEVLAIEMRRRRVAPTEDDNG